MSLSMERSKFDLRFTPLPDMKLEPSKTASSLQLYFKISNHVNHKAIEQTFDGTQSTIGNITDQPREACLWIDSGLFNSSEEVCKIFTPELLRLGFWSSQDCALVVWRIMEKVKIMVGSVPRRRKVMVTEVEIVMEIIHRFRVLESDNFDRAMRESRREFEETNYGMVAGAAPSALRRMMKMVEVEGGEEECRICLEEMEEGAFGMSMPCDHVFHSNCILKWLQTSYSCPLCRFEMPTTGLTYQPIRLG